MDKIKDLKDNKKKESIMPLIIALAIVIGIMLMPIFPNRTADGKVNGSISYAQSKYNSYSQIIKDIKNASLNNSETPKKIWGIDSWIFDLGSTILFLIILFLLIGIFKKKFFIVINTFVRNYWLPAAVLIIISLGSLNALYTPNSTSFIDNVGSNFTIAVKSLYSAGEGNPTLWIPLTIAFLILGFYFLIYQIKEELDKNKTAKQILAEVSLDPDKYLFKEDKEKTEKI